MRRKKRCVRRVLRGDHDGATMLNFFKRSEVPATRPTSNVSIRSTAPKARDRRGSSGPFPVPEVVEGNEDSDWALWEESVSFQDSQMPSLSPTSVSATLCDGPSADRVEPLDAFSSVHKHAP